MDVVSKLYELPVELSLNFLAFSTINHKSTILTFPALGPEWKLGP